MICSCHLTDSIPERYFQCIFLMCIWVCNYRYLLKHDIKNFDLLLFNERKKCYYFCLSNQKKIDIISGWIEMRGSSKSKPFPMKSFQIKTSLNLFEHKHTHTYEVRVTNTHRLVITEKLILEKLVSVFDLLILCESSKNHMGNL